MKLNQRQQALVNALEQFKSGSRGVVVAFEGFLQDYVKSFSAHELDFIFTALKRQPRLLNAAKIIIGHELPVEIKKVKGQWTCTNKENLSKSEKAKAREAVKKFIAKELTSLLNHDKIKVVVEYSWEKKSTTFKKQVQDALDNGVDKQLMIDMITAMQPKAE